MKKFVLSVDEDLKCSTVSSRAHLVVSPRGSIYFPGNRARRNEEDTTIDSYSGTILRKSKVELIIDANNLAFDISKHLGGFDKSFSIDPPNEQRKITTFDALENRYSHLIDQSSFNFSGVVNIAVEVIDPKKLLVEKFVHKIQISSALDFQQVLDHIRLTKPVTGNDLDAETEFANMERSYSALKL